MINIEYSAGTITTNTDPQLAELRRFMKYDKRTHEWRYMASHYRQLISQLTLNNTPFKDLAKHYRKVPLKLAQPITPREHQSKALHHWLKAKGHGVVSLPTGAGKTILAMLCMEKIQRSTLVIVPTIDLLNQWRGVIEKFFGVQTGALGGGSYDIQDITVSTYDSAAKYVEHFGNKFGFLVVDECHHLPAPQYITIAKSMIAPFRLGLSATVERADAKEELIYQQLGDLVYSASILELKGDVLAPYTVESIKVLLTEEEKQSYKKHRKLYLDFLKKNSINMASHGGWQRFIFLASRSLEGREALKSHRIQKRMAQTASQKLQVIWDLLKKHQGERAIIFTDDNEFAYHIGTTFALAVLTHHTKAAERKKMLTAFGTGEIDCIVTSKVLNEGVDVPEASVAIVASGSAGVREHVQRLGRILRHQAGKSAILYELVADDTSEYFVNQRRRSHDAYQKFAPR